MSQTGDHQVTSSSLLCNEDDSHTVKFEDGWLSLVEGTGFENRRRGNSTGGSNPSPSA